MISQEAFDISENLAYSLAEKGLVISTKPNSVIGELCRLSNYDYMGMSIHTTDTMQNLITKVITATNGDHEYLSPHDAFMNESISLIAKSVGNHISVAKNVVVPIIAEYAKILHTAMDVLYQGKNANTAFTIELMEIPEPLTDNKCLDLFSIYDKKFPLEPGKLIKLAPKTDADLLDLLQIGSNKTNELIIQWYNRIGSEFFNKVWVCYFDDSTIGNQHFGEYDKWRNDVLSFNNYDKLDIGLAIYLFASKLYSHVEDNLTGISLTTYQDAMSRTRDFGGTIVSNSLRTIKLIEKNGTFVMDLDHTNKKCYVVRTLYHEWLNKGGKPEAILGMLVSDDYSYRTVTAVNDNMQLLIDKWNSFSTYYHASENNNRFSYFKDACVLCFNQMLENLTELEQDYVAKHPSYYISLNTYLTEELSQLKPSDMLDLYAVGQKLICNARFYYTNAGKILDSIVEAGKAQPGINPREAALIATINYVAEYVCDQMYLETQ